MTQVKIADFLQLENPLGENVDFSALADLGEPLPVPTIDSHTHLDATVEATGLSVDQLIAAAKQVNVVKMVQIGCDVPSSKWALECANAHEEVVAAVAIHPNDAARTVERESMAALDELIGQIDQLAERGASSGKVRAVGETGLDYYRTRDPQLHEVQKYSFKAHIEIAKKHQLALAIHDRDAHQDVLAVVDEVGAPDRVIMHCFSGDEIFAQQCLERGWFLSFPGVVTFKNSGRLKEALAICPIENLLVETDAPYLTPMPHRGKKNASYVMAHTVRFMAEHTGQPLDKLCRQLMLNAERAYGGSW